MADGSPTRKRTKMAPGDRYGRLVAIEAVPHTSGRWRFACDCGRMKTISAKSVRFGDTRSCGCLRSELSAQRTATRITHGRTNTPEYASWLAMRKRCYDPNNIGFKDYGGRGIMVCERWINSFENFFSDMGQRPAGTSIDRIDSNGNYEPSNCRWSTSKEQNSNTRSTHNLTYNGETLTVRGWGERLGINPQTLHKRLNLGWPTERVLSEPIDAAKSRPRAMG